MEHTKVAWFDYEGYQAEIHVDESPESPRTWDNLCKLVVYSKRGLNYMEVNELDTNFCLEDYASWEEHDKNVLLCYPGAIFMPVYRYEHGDVAYKLTKDGDSWDTARVGMLVALRPDILKEYKVKRITKNIKQRVEALMAAELDSYSMWCNGHVYGYIVKDGNGNELPDGTDVSCWGLYGLEYAEEEAKTQIRFLLQNKPVMTKAQWLNEFAELAAQLEDIFVNYAGEDGDVTWEPEDKVEELEQIIESLFSKVSILVHKYSMDKLIGFYNPYGYRIARIKHSRGHVAIEDVYSAGNSPCDSAMVVSIEHGESLETLKAFCEQTGKEMAEELGLGFVGAELEESSYSEEDL